MRYHQLRSLLASSTWARQWSLSTCTRVMPASGRWRCANCSTLWSWAWTWKCSASELTSIWGREAGDPRVPSPAPPRRPAPDGSSGPPPLSEKGSHPHPAVRLPAGRLPVNIHDEPGARDMWRKAAGRPRCLHRYPRARPPGLPQGSLKPTGLPSPAPGTSKGSPSTSGKTPDTSSWPQRPPWKVLPTMVALEKRGLTWKAMSPASDRKLISNLWGCHGGCETADGWEVTHPRPRGGPRGGRGTLLVLSRVRVSLDQQAPARGQAPCTEGFKLRAKGGTGCTPLVQGAPACAVPQDPGSLSNVPSWREGGGPPSLQACGRTPGTRGVSPTPAWARSLLTHLQCHLTAFCGWGA